MTIGKRIRTIRIHRELTQKQLGEMLGYKNSPSVRIAQYETGQRSPMPNALKKFSNALKVAPEALDIPNIDNHTVLMHLLFALEEFFNLRIESINDEVCLIFNNDEITGLLSEWLKQYKAYQNGELSEQEYKEWEYNYSRKKC